MIFTICSNAGPLCQGFDRHQSLTFIDFTCKQDISVLEQTTSKLCPTINFTVFKRDSVLKKDELYYTELIFFGRRLKQ